MLYQSSTMNYFNASLHGKKVSENKLWHFVIATYLENKQVATIYDVSKKKYYLQNTDGINIVVTKVKDYATVLIENHFNRKVELVLKNEKIDTFYFKDFIKDINNIIEDLNDKFHQEIYKKQLNIHRRKAVKILESGRIKSKFFYKVEHFIAYQQAFFNMIETGRIFSLSYMNKNKKFSVEQFPKNKLINAYKYDDITNVSLVKTQITSLEKQINSRIKQFSSSKLESIASWACFDTNKKIQYYINDYLSVILPYTVSEEEEDGFFLDKGTFYLNSKDEKISNIVSNSSSGFFDILEKSFKVEEKPIFERYCNTVDLNNFIKMFSKGASIHRYVLSEKHDSQKIEEVFLMALNFDEKVFMASADVLYYSFRDLVLFAEENETISLKGYPDKIILETDNGKKFAISSLNYDKEIVNDINFMHDNLCLFEPIDFDKIIKIFRKKLTKNNEDGYGRVKTIDKIKDFIERQKEIEGLSFDE